MKLLIVDQAERSREAIRTLLNFNEYGIDKMLEADNGSAAKEIILAEKPQIIISDMMMPPAKGIEFMKWINENCPMAKFIAISKHDDFEMVRQTVRYGGIDYLLKPVEKGLLHAAILKAVSLWRREENERIIQQQHQRRAHFNPFNSKELMSSLIDEPSLQELTVNRLVRQSGLPEDIRVVRVAASHIDLNDVLLHKRFGMDTELLFFALLNIANEYVQQDNQGAAFRYVSGKNEIVILFWNADTDVPATLRQINEGLFQTLQRRLHFGISAWGEFPAQLPGLHEHALDALQQRNVLRPELTVHELKPDNAAMQSDKAPPSFSDYEQEWRQAALSGMPEQMAMAVEMWTNPIKKLNVISQGQLEEWNKQIHTFCIQLADETPGVTPDKLINILGQGPNANTPSPGSFEFSLSNWHNYWYQLLQQLARAMHGLV